MTSNRTAAASSTIQRRRPHGAEGSRQDPIVKEPIATDDTDPAPADHSSSPSSSGASASANGTGVKTPGTRQIWTSLSFRPNIRVMHLPRRRSHTRSPDAGMARAFLRSGQPAQICRLESGKSLAAASKIRRSPVLERLNQWLAHAFRAATAWRTAGDQSALGLPSTSGTARVQLGLGAIVIVGIGVAKSVHDAILVEIAISARRSMSASVWAVLPRFLSRVHTIIYAPRAGCDHCVTKVLRPMQLLRVIRGYQRSFSSSPVRARELTPMIGVF